VPAVNQIRTHIGRRAKKDIQEVLQIQSDFFKSQLAAAQEQMKQMGTEAASAAKELEQDIKKS
jgi:hypothetical protein